MSIPEGYILKDGKLSPMTKEERVIAGLDEPQPGYKVKDNEIVPMPLGEQLETGQITQEEYEQYLTTENENELQRRISDLQTPEALAQAEVDEEYAAERKAMLKSLLAVKKQPGWPLAVEWPE